MHSNCRAWKLLVLFLLNTSWSGGFLRPAFFDFCDLSRVVEKPTLSKKPSLGWEENSCPTRRASVYGRCDSRGPGANMRTQSLMVCSRRSVGELQLFVSSDCSLWESAVTPPILSATGSCGPFCPCCARALEASSCRRVSSGGRHRLLWCSLVLCFAFPGCIPSLELPIPQRCWFTAHLTGGPRHHTKSSR